MRYPFRELLLRLLCCLPSAPRRRTGTDTGANAEGPTTRRTDGSNFVPVTMRCCDAQVRGLAGVSRDYQGWGYSRSSKSQGNVKNLQLVWSRQMAPVSMNHPTWHDGVMYLGNPAT